MKPATEMISIDPAAAFSALGRAVWDETFIAGAFIASVEPFSALGRAVWDETW